jgi:signal transduction histidine kinase
MSSETKAKYLSSYAAAVFKNLRTSTKLFLLCGMFVGSIMLATYSLIEEKQIAIRFVRKELLGAQYLEALRGVYAIILDDAGLQGAGKLASVDAALDALAAAEAAARGLPYTAKMTHALAATVRRLSSEASGDERRALIVETLAKARDLAAQIGDESNLALDPDLDSYYVQNIVIKGVPTLLFEIGELHSLLRTASPTGPPPNDDPHTRALLLGGMIRSTLDQIERDAAAAQRAYAEGQQKEALVGAISSMLSAVNVYLEGANTTVTSQVSSASLAPSYAKALESINGAWRVSQEELKRLLNTRLSNLLAKLGSSLALNGLVAGLSLLFAALTYRQIVRPLGQLEQLASNVRDTKDYSLRMNFDRRDEIGRLADAFDAMLKELASSRQREIADQERNDAMQAELARVSRLTTMGEMAASIAHEINQPLAGVVNNANAGLRWLNKQPPNIEEARSALRRIVGDGERGSSIIESIRAMLKKGNRTRVKLDLNELIRDVMTLTQSQFQRHGVSIRSELADGLPRVSADRVQLQQVILNLLMNAADAVVASSDQERLVCVRSEQHDSGGALISVQDSGIGIEPEDAKRIFEAFFTKKADGMGMGLSICRSIERGARTIATLPASETSLRP